MARKIVNKNVNRKDLEEMSKSIVTAVDFIVGKQLKGMKDDVRIIKSDLIKIDKKIDRVKDDLKKDISGVTSLIDGYVKAQEEFKQEFVIMKEEVRQIKAIIKNKLGVEIRAI